jgi:hypothetical protein
MATKYTRSPLGLIPDNNGIRTIDGKSSVFSNKNFLKQPASQRTGLSKHPLQFGNISETHSDEVYNISTQNIIDKLNSYDSMRLKFADFAYCRDYGVYPNNRLVICRRFPSPVTDDLTFNGVSKDYTQPISTLISWFDDQKNTLEFSFGEIWEDSDASFKSLLNDAGKDIGMKGQNFQLGDILFSGLNIVPLPGATEGLQRKLLTKLGFIGSDDEATENIIPSGTPNLVKESKRRTTIKDDIAGSGLKGKFTVNVKCAWEQKFISGVDPTLIYYDILQTVLSFGGSEAVFYLGKKSNLTKLDQKLTEFLKPGGASKIVKEIVEAFAEVIREFGDKLKKVVREFFDSSDASSDASLSEKEQEEQAKARAKDEKEQRERTINEATTGVSNLLKTFADTIIKKYRVAALGIVTSLTGIPSTPWHVTLGNPLRPIFSSGDMLCEDVTINLGPQLAFNDLPSSIEAEFRLVSARNLGIDEIMEKLSCGAIRITVEQPTFWNKVEGDNTPNSDSGGGNTTPPSGPTATPPTNNEVKEEDAPVVATQSTADQSKVGNESSTDTTSTNGQTVNPDANSSEPILGKTELPTSKDEEYTVKKGDTIWGIAKKSLGPDATNAEVNAKMKEIIAKNKNKNPSEADGIVKAGQNSDPDFIVPGEKLII